MTLNRSKKTSEKSADNVWAQALKNRELAPVTHYLSTGCTLMDLAIANRLPGGFPGGRISHVYGTESSAKSVLAQYPMGSAQRQGGNAYSVDSEGTMDLLRARDLFGVDITKLFQIGQGNEQLTIERLFDLYLPVAEEGASKLRGPSVGAVDSLSAIPSAYDMSTELTDMNYAPRAKALTKGFCKHIWALNKSNLAMIFIDQVRQNISGYGKKWVFSGGEALKFYASTRTFTTKAEDIKNKYDRVLGIWVNFRVDKNKIAPPFREGKFRLIFDQGIDDIGTSLQWIKGIRKESSYILGHKKYQGLSQAVEAVRNRGNEEMLRQDLWDLWKEVHSG